MWSLETGNTLAYVRSFLARPVLVNAHTGLDAWRARVSRVALALAIHAGAKIAAVMLASFFVAVFSSPTVLASACANIES